MNSTLAAEWRVLKRGKPGHRFQDSYETGRKAVDRLTVAGRLMRIALGVISLAVGVVLVFIPGPAILFFAIAGALFASESRTVARVLDGCELRLRVVLRWGLRHWRALSKRGKLVAGSIIAIAAVAAAFASYRLFFH